MILAGQTIRRFKPVTPFEERTVLNGMSYGLSHAGYDVRLRDPLVLYPRQFALGVTVEQFDMPSDVLAQVCDKSSWARRGLSLFNTIIEPGWRGFLTLELMNFSDVRLDIPAGSPIAQIIFMQMDEPTERPYAGKYQDAPPIPQSALDEQQSTG